MRSWSCPSSPRASPRRARRTGRGSSYTHPSWARSRPNLPQGPFREALELADKATFSQEELDAYQKVVDEIQQVRDLADAKWAEGKAEGKTEEAARSLLTVLRVRGLAVPDAARERILAQKDPALLDRWLEKAIVAASIGEVMDDPS